MDANFKLKQKERGFADPPLSNGLAYMISDATLKAHLTECTAKKLTSEVPGHQKLLSLPLTLLY